MDAYFSGKKDLFAGLKIDKLEKNWDRYPVFRIDFAGGDYTNQDELKNKLEKYIGNWEKEYGKDEFSITLSDRFQYILEAAEKKTGKKAVELQRI